uniref:Uncharacterized protein n=1 Tax=Haptolina brevifila TaxID=156173 RepID=A0A7S2GCR7_9EUKA
MANINTPKVGKMRTPSAAELGEKFRWYLTLETSWWVSVYAICYRCQPSVALMQTKVGSAMIRHVGRWLQRAWPSRYDSISQSFARMYESPNGRTFGEWLLVNKVLAPVSFPMKLALANRIVNQRAALASAAGVAYVATEASRTEEADLTPEVEPAQILVRSVTNQMVQTLTVKQLTTHAVSSIAASPADKQD